MATTRLMPMHIGKGRTVSTAIADVIDYVENPQKTDNGKLITGYACDTRTADAEFPRAIKIDGIDYDVIVYVVLIYMSANDKSVVALRQLHGKLAPVFVCQLRCDLAGLEGLPQMIGDHVVAAPPARELKILPLR